MWADRAKNAEAMITGLTENGTERADYQNFRSYCEQQLVVHSASVTVNIRR